MRKRYERFTVVVVLLLLTFSGISHTAHSRWQLAATVRPILFAAFDAETVLTLGLRLPLGCADIWSLELIPRVSRQVIARLYSQRQEILRYARDNPEEDALKRVFGIGDSTAQYLLDYISLADICVGDTPAYTPFTRKP
jgi:hypothetical protein